MMPALDRIRTVLLSNHVRKLHVGHALWQQARDELASDPGLRAHHGIPLADPALADEPHFLFMGIAIICDVDLDGDTIAMGL